MSGAVDVGLDLEAIRVIIADNAEAIAKALSELTEEDLARALVEFGGLNDPLGQLQNWILQQLSSFGNWLVNQLSTVFSNVIQPFISAVYSGMQQIVSTLAAVTFPAINSFINAVVSGLTTLGSLAQNALTTVQGAFSTLASLVSQYTNNIISSLTSLGGYVTQLFSQAASSFSSFASSIQTWFSQLGAAFSGLASAVQGAFQSVTTYVSTAIAQAGQLFSQLASGVQNALASLLSAVQSGLSTVVSWIQNAASTLQSALGTLYNYIQSGLSTVVSAIQSGLSTVASWIQNAVGTLQGVFGTLYNYIQSGLSAVAGWIQNAISAIQNAAGTLYSYIQNGLSVIQSGLSTVVNFIMNIPTYVQQAISIISTGLQNIWNTISTTVAGWVQQLLTWLGQVPTAFYNLWNFIASELTSFYNTAKAAGVDIYNTAKQTYDMLVQLPGFIAQSIQAAADIPNVAAKIAVDTIANTLKELLQPVMPTVNTIISAVQGFVTGIKDFVKDPVGWLRDHLVVPLLNALTALGQILWSGLQTLWSAIQPLLLDLRDAMISLGRTLWEGLAGLGRAMWSGLEWLGQTLTSWLGDLGRTLMTTYVIAPTVLAAAISGRGKWPEHTPFTVAASLTLTALTVILPLMLASGAIEGIGDTLKELVISMEPVGVGAQIRAKMLAVVEKVGKALGKAFEKVPEHSLMPLLLAVFEPFRFVARAWWKSTFSSLGFGDVPFELPSEHVTIELARRFDVRQMRDRVVGMLAYRGFPDWAITYATMLAPSTAFGDAWTQAYNALSQEVKNGYITVYDRFGNVRYVPLSLLYHGVTPAELVAFHLKDLFLPPNLPPPQQPVVAAQSFAKWAYILGMTPDVALFHYLHSYHLPSPEMLWRFTVRGMAGQLWFKPPHDVVDFARSEAKLLGAFEPKTPAELNLQHETLLFALAEYQKWHGRAHFAWISDFTSDAWLIIDQLAKLPHVEDMRWMLRHGIVEMLSKRGIKLGSTLQEIISAALDAQPASGIAVDTTFFSQMILADEYHPYWLPLLAGAEAMNIIQPEKTLIRTGWLELYRDWLLDADTMDRLMSGIYTVSIKTAYFDLDTKQWREGWLNVPLYWLPHDRKLLILRAVFDRAHYALRYFWTALDYGIRNHLMPIEEWRGVMKTYVDLMSTTYFVPAVAAVTGMPPSAVPPLKFDESIAPVLDSFFQFQSEMYTRERIRTYARYFLYQIVYALRQGYLGTSLAAQYIDSLVALMHEVPELTQLLMAMDQLLLTVTALRHRAEAVGLSLSHGVIDAETARRQLLALGMDSDVVDALVAHHGVQRQLALMQPITIAQYVPEALKLYPQHLSLLRVVPWWREYLIRYAEARRIATDVRRLLTQALGAYHDTPTYAKVLDSIAPLLEQIGYDDKRLSIVKQIADVMAARRRFIESVPTMRGFLADAAYLPDWRAWLATYVDQRWLTDAAKQYYLFLAHARHIASDVRRLLTQLLDLAYYSPQYVNIVDKYADLLEQIGYDDERLAIVKQIIEVMTQRRRFMESVPTVRQLVADARYFADWENVMKKYLALRWVTSDAAQYYMDLAYARRIYVDVRMALTQFLHLLYTTPVAIAMFSAIEPWLRDAGYDDDKLQLVALRALMMINRAAFHESVPTVREAIADSMYFANWREVLQSIFAQRWVEPKAQEYYMRLAYNRRMWRWIRGVVFSVVYAYYRGNIDDVALLAALQQLKQYGVTDDEIQLIVMEAKYRRCGYLGICQ